MNMRQMVAGWMLCLALVGCAQEKAEPTPLPRASVSGVDSAADEAAVAQAFTAYQKALVAKDGKAAASMLTGDTIAYYAALKKLALTAKEPYLRRARVSDQLAVLYLRAGVEAADLRRWSATDLAADAVRRGELNTSAIERMTVGEVKVSVDSASVTMILDGKANPFSLTFWREGGRWKFRMIPVLEAIEYAMRTQVEESHLTERQFVDKTLATILTSPDELTAVWLPAGGG
ncbi:hypothetical protein [Kribbella sp. NPDC051620]|uniref:hypothetical protein n=1 Tax=Kribbella sp. NPDC051620 TaxID=3364120 RepID=UPI0037B4091E